MFAAALVLLVSQSSIDVWIDELSSEHPQVRANAVERLVESGDEAALALEHEEFLDPEARSLANEILRVLRHPTCLLRAPRFVDASRAMVHVELIVQNRRPEEIRIEPYWLTVKGRLRRNSRWSIELPPRIGAVATGHKLLRQALLIPARSEATYTIPVVTRLKGQVGLPISVSYRGPDFELKARGRVGVGRESYTELRRRALSNRESERSIVVFAIQGELRMRRKDRAFHDLLRLAARSPHRDVRIGIGQALGRFGQRGNRSLIRVACSLASDRDMTTARAGYYALGRLLPPELDMPEVRRLAAKAFARPDDGRSKLMIGLVGRWRQDERRVFLANVLAGSRSRRAHAEIASLLRQDGIPVEPGASGLVPRSQIRNLRD